jgi:hypothetical protein
MAGPFPPQPVLEVSTHRTSIPQTRTPLPPERKGRAGPITPMCHPGCRGEPVPTALGSAASVHGGTGSPLYVDGAPCGSRRHRTRKADSGYWWWPGEADPACPPLDGGGSGATINPLDSSRRHVLPGPGALPLQLAVGRRTRAPTPTGNSAVSAGPTARCAAAALSYSSRRRRESQAERPTAPRPEGRSTQLAPGRDQRPKGAGVSQPTHRHGRHHPRTGRGCAGRAGTPSGPASKSKSSRAAAWRRLWGSGGAMSVCEVGKKPRREASKPVPMPRAPSRAVTPVGAVIDLNT